MFIDALVPAIEQVLEPIQAIVPRLASLRHRLLSNPRVTEAVVVQIASDPADQIRPLLEQMTDWKKPKHPGSAYADALRVIGEKCPGLLGELGF